MPAAKSDTMIDVIKYPLTTKKISTPAYPPLKRENPAWKKITGSTAKARRPSISGLYFIVCGPWCIWIDRMYGRVGDAPTDKPHTNQPCRIANTMPGSSTIGVVSAVYGLIMLVTGGLMVYFKSNPEDQQLA